MKAIALTSFGIPEVLEELEVPIPAHRHTGSHRNARLFHQSRRYSIS